MSSAVSLTSFQSKDECKLDNLQAADPTRERVTAVAVPAIAAAAAAPPPKDPSPSTTSSAATVYHPVKKPSVIPSKSLSSGMSCYYDTLGYFRSSLDIKTEVLLKKSFIEVAEIEVHINRFCEQIIPMLIKNLRKHPTNNPEMSGASPVENEFLNELKNNFKSLQKKTTLWQYLSEKENIATAIIKVQSKHLDEIINKLEQTPESIANFYFSEPPFQDQARHERYTKEIETLNAGAASAISETSLQTLDSTIEQNSSIKSALLKRYIACRLGFLTSNWSPDQPFSVLVEELKTKKSPLIIGGWFGSKTYATPPISARYSLDGKEVYGWPPQVGRKKGFAAHVIAIIGTDTLEGKDVVYYFDVQFPERIMRRSYDKLKLDCFSLLLTSASASPFETVSKYPAISFMSGSGFALYNPEYSKIKRDELQVDPSE